MNDLNTPPNPTPGILLFLAGLAAVIVLACSGVGGMTASDADHATACGADQACSSVAREVR